jgi:hypothetical protein
MKLDVPFLPEAGYAGFLEKHEDALYSVHYSLQQPGIPDGRHQTSTCAPALLNRELSRLENVKKYALLNSRFHAPSACLEKESIKAVLDILAQVLNEDNLDGIVFADFYFLEALSDASPEISGLLEAVPGINCMLDSFDRIQSCLAHIARTRFRMPAKLNLDRSLNRKIEMLEEVAASCCEKYPGILLTLLANEGCLHFCPFKFAHDALIAYANLETCPSRNYDLNSRFGCIRVLTENPEEILRSPFIRPEDQKYYTPFADILKICGRTLGTEFLRNTITAYIRGAYEGNLLTLLDTQDWQVDRTMIANTDFSRDFLEKLTTCSHSCAECGYCRNLFARISSRQPPAPKDFRPPEPAE